jgi:uncharacterized protein (DUF362 family)
MKTKKFKQAYFNRSAILIGALSTIWFLVRVIPKPSRALYPCQRAAFPLASSFIIWLLGSIISVGIIKRAKRGFFTSWKKSIVLLVIGVFVFFGSYMFLPAVLSYAGNIGQIEYLPTIKVQNARLVDSFNAKVAVIQSDKSTVWQIDQNEIQTMVEQAIDLAGGLDVIINNGDLVVIKPNVVIDYNYADNQTLGPGPNGIATDYRVIQSVVNIINEINPTGKIYLMEGSAIGNTLENMETIGYNQITGIDSMIAIEENSGGWYEYSSNKLTSVNLPDSIALYPDDLKPNQSRAIYQNKIYHDADVLISIPVLKNHFYTGITGAVKNVGIGATPGKIYGTGQTAEYPTQRYGIEHDNRTNLNQWIHDFYACRPVDFVIMDGLQGSDNGPVASDYTALSQAQRNMRVILAGKDAIAVDAIESLIMGHDPLKISHLVYLHNDGYGWANPNLIEVLGTQVEDIRVNFKTGDSGLASKFNTFSSDNYNIQSITYYQDSLKLSILDTAKLVRIEVSIDSQKYESMIIGGFNNITIPLDGFTIGDSIVEILFVDRYLNTLKKSYQGDYISGIRNYTMSSYKISIYPNPATDILNIELSKSFTGPYQLEVYSLDGKLMISKNGFNNSNGQVNINALKPGVYVLRVIIGNELAQILFTKSQIF